MVDMRLERGGGGGRCEIGGEMEVVADVRLERGGGGGGCENGEGRRWWWI